jgi:threonine 3-dehydrogenase
MSEHIRKPGVLVTGANGEMGHGLIEYLGRDPGLGLIAVDIQPLDESLKSLCAATVTGDILDPRLLERVKSEFEIVSVFHLAALLSTRAEFTPEAAHRVNVEGTLNLLTLSIEQSRWHGTPVRFFFPSSIAVYGLPSRAIKQRVGRIAESDWNVPSTMYGCNKMYCEHLGRYYARHYRQLASDPLVGGIDFRSIRFPGLISAATLPSGGTSDYAPEMIHAAAQGKPYECFVREDVRIPLMAMPDAIRAMLMLHNAPRESLTRLVYNIGSFNPSAGEIVRIVSQAFGNASVQFRPDDKRQAIVDTWPEDVDDAAARNDWGWQPEYDLKKAFSDYLIPGITARYQSQLPQRDG